MTCMYCSDQQKPYVWKLSGTYKQSVRRASSIRLFTSVGAIRYYVCFATRLKETDGYIRENIPPVVEDAPSAGIPDS